MSPSVNCLDLWKFEIPAASILDLAKEIAFVGETSFLQHEGFVTVNDTRGEFLVTKVANKLVEGFHSPWRYCSAREAIHILLQSSRLNCCWEIKSILTYDCLSLRTHLHTQVRTLSVAWIEGKIHFSTSYPTEEDWASKSLWIQKIP